MRALGRSGLEPIGWACAGACSLLLVALPLGCETLGDTGNPLGGGGQSGGGDSTGGDGQSGAGQSAGGAGQSGVHTNPLSQELIAAFVAAHNQARSGPLDPPPSPPLPPVTWDAVLADVAFNYTSLCQGTGGLVNHNENRERDYRALGGNNYVGENIYATTAGSVQPAEAMAGWMSEALDYDYAANNIGAATGHYTQVVWRDSVHIGCAIVDCPSLRYHNTVLCDYAPGGNLTTKKPY